MPNKYIRKDKAKSRAINEQTYKNAVALVESGKSIRSAAKETGISEFGLRYRIKTRNMKSIGGQQSLPDVSEAELYKLLALKSKWGFASTRQEVKELVCDYVKSNKTLETPLGDYLRKYCKFKVAT